jgi:hypothetical protein
MGRLAMQLSCGATDDVGKFGSYDRRGRKIKNETPVISQAPSVREDVCICTFNTSHGKDCLDWGSAILEGGRDMNASTLEALFTEHEVWLRKTFGYMPKMYVFIKITKKDDIWIGTFPNNQLGNKLLKEDSVGRMQIASSLKVPLILFSFGCPSRTGRSWAGRLICHHNSGFFIATAHLKPAPAAKAGRVNSWLCHLGSKASHCHHCATTMLILLHLFFYIVGNYTSSIHTNPNNIPVLLLLGSLVPICLGLAAYQNICVELMAKFIQSINLHPFCEHPQTINIFHCHADAIIWLFPGCLPICWLVPKISNLLGDLILGALLV